MAKSIFDEAAEQVGKAASQVAAQAAKQVQKQLTKKKKTDSRFYDDYTAKKQQKAEPSSVQGKTQRATQKTFVPVTRNKTAFVPDTVLTPQKNTFLPSAAKKTNTNNITNNHFTPRRLGDNNFQPATTTVPLRDQLGMLNKFGNVDHLKRPVIGTWRLEQAGWGKQNDGLATVYSSSFSNEDGTKTILVTPVLQSGKVLTPRELEKAANTILATGKDENNILLGTFTGANSISEANKYGQRIHRLHEQYYTDYRQRQHKKMSDKDMRKMITETDKEDFGSFYPEEKERQDKIARMYKPKTPEELKEDELKRKYVSRLEKYQSVLNNPDFQAFASGQRYNSYINKTKPVDKVGEAIGKITSDKGDYSKMEDIRSFKRYYRQNKDGSISEIRTNNSNADSLKYMYMTGDEYNIYKYYLNKYGENDAEKYLRDIEPQLDQRRTELSSAYKKEWAKGHKVKAVFADLAGSVMSGLPALGDAIEQTYRQANQKPDEYIPYNPYTPANALVHTQNALKEGVIGDLEGTPKFLANAAFSIGENVVRLPLEAVNPAVGLGLMGANVAGSTAVNQGVSGETSAGKALLTGAVFGAAEIATEKLSLDNLIKIVNAPTTTAREFARTFVPNMLKQAGIEASEEVAANIIDNMADSLINGDKSEYSKRVNELMRQGYDRGTAEGLAFKELYIDQSLEEGLAGGLSGLVMGGFGGVASSAVNTYNEATTIGREYNVEDNNYEAVRGLIEEGKASERQTAANKYAERMGKKLDKRGRISDWNVGRQVVKNEAAIQGENDLAKAASNIKETNIVPYLETEDDDGNTFELNGVNTKDSVYASVNGSQSVPETIKHEMTHVFKQMFPKAYKEFEDTVFQAAMEADSDAVEERMRKLKEYGYSDEVIREEIVAELATGFNTHAVQRMAEGSHNFADRMAQAMRTAKAAFRSGFTNGNFTSSTGVSATFDGLNKAEKQYLNMAQQARNNTSAQTVEVRYSPIEYDINGKPFVAINEDILSGVTDAKDQRATVRKYILDNFPTIQVNGEEIKVNAGSRGEFTNSKYTRTLERTNKGVYEDKLRSARNLDEMVQARQNIRPETLNHSRKDRITGFEKGDVTFRVGKNYYDASVLIGLWNDGTKVFHDIVDIKKNTGVVPRVSSQNANNSGRNQQPVSYKNSISENNGNVKDIDAEYLEAVKNGDIKKASFPDNGSKTNSKNAVRGKQSSTNSIRENDPNVKRFSIKESNEYTPDKVARRLVNENNANGRVYVKDVREGITELARMVPDVFSGNVEENYPAFEAKARELAETIADASRQTQDVQKEQYNELRKWLKSERVKITDELKSDIPDFNAYRKSLMGLVTFSNDGTGIDQIYKELSARFPQYFNEQEQMTQSDQLTHLADTLQKLKNYETAVSDKDYDAYVEDLTQQIVRDAQNLAPNVKPKRPDKGVTKYTDEEATKISKIGPTYSHYVLDKDMSLRVFFERNARKKNNIYEKLYMGKISDNLSERIDSILKENGINESVKGEHFIITNDFVEHTKRKHSIGSNETAEQVTGDNIDLLRDVINQPDDVSFGGLNENKKPVIVFKKNIDGANAIYVQFSSLKRNGLIGKTLYFDRKIKNEATLAHDGDNTSALYVQNDQSQASTDNISQDDGKVNRFTQNADINEIVNSDMTDAEKRKALEDGAHFVPRGGKSTEEIVREAQERGKEHFNAQQKVKPSNYSEDDWESYGEEFGTDNMRQDMQRRSAEAERRDREKEARRNSRYSEEDWADLEEPVPKGYDWTKDAENWKESKPKQPSETEKKAEAHEKLVQMMEEKGVSSPSELAEDTVLRADIKKAKIKHYLSPKGIHEIGTMAYTRMVDDMHPIFNYTDSFEKAMTRINHENGTKEKFVAKGKQSPYKMAMNAKDATSRSAYLITDYLTDFDANIIGKGLNDTIAESGINLETLEDFNKYLVARHATYWLDENRGGKYKRVYEDDALNNVTAAQEMAEDFEKRYPEFKQAAENIYEWEKKMGQAWLIDTGVITQGQWDHLWEMYPNYVPFYRAEMVNAGGDGTGMINVDNVFKKAEGSSQKILSPIENIMYNTASYVNHAYKHAVVKPAVDMFDILEADPENNVLREFWTEVVPEDPAELVPTRFIEKTTLTENDLRRSSVQQRFSENVDKAFSGEITERTPITIGDTPTLYKKYGAGDNPLTITQSTMYKIAYPTGYFGAEETGHNLGIPALKQLPKQIASPIAILKSNTQQDSLIALTEWEDANGNPVIIPLHLDKNGALGLTNEVASAYGKKDIEPLLTDKNGKSTVLYTKNNESIHQLLSSRLQLPAAASDDTLVKHNISNNEGNVNNQNFVPDERDFANATEATDEAGITRTLHQQTGVDYGVVSVMKDGQMRYFRVNDKEFLKAIDNTRKGREGWLATAAAITRARGALLTSLNPAFSLVTNTIKDAGTYLTNSTDVNKAKAIGAAATAYLDMAKNAYHQKKGDVYSNEVTQYIAMGGQYSNLHTAGTNQLKKAMNDMRGGKRNTAKNVATFIPHAYLALGDAIESAPRVGQFKRTLKETGDIHEAFYQAKDVTVNFSRMGTWGRYINSFSNFFNAAIQGSDKMFRMAKNNPGSMAVGMAALALVSAAAYGFSHLKKDDKYDEAWKDLSNYQKNNNWNFYIGGGKFVSIPKPRENATLITAGEAAIDKYMFGQEDRFKDFFSNYILSALPDGNIPFVTSLIQIGMNEDYRGVPIVSKELEGKPKELQFDDNTTYFAKWLGQKTGQSPKQIDHILSNETGALQRANKTYGSPNGLKDKAAIYSFGLSNTFLKDAYYSTDMTNGFYTNKEEAEKQANGYPSADTEYLYSRYSQAGNVMGIINQMVKDNADDKFKGRKRDMENNRWFKRAYTNYAADYKDNPLGFSDEVYQEIKGLYDEDKSVLELPEINSQLKAKVDGVQKTYKFDDPYTVIKYQKDLNNAIDKAYRDVISTAEYQTMDNADKAAALKKAKTDAANSVKESYVANKGRTESIAQSGGTLEKPAEGAVAQAQAKKDRKADITSNYVQKLSDDFAAANPGIDGYDTKTLMKIEPKKVTVGGKEYEVSGETANKIAAAAEEKFYDNIESFYNGDVPIEYLIGRKADGTAYYTQKIGSKKKSADLVGKRYDANGNKRFNEADEAKIIFKLRDAAINAAAEEYAEEITGGKQTADVKPVASSNNKSNGVKTASRGKSYRSFSPRQSYSRRSGGGRRSSGGGSSRGTSSGGTSGGGGRGVSVALSDIKDTSNRFMANNDLYGSLNRPAAANNAGSKFQVNPPSLARVIKPKKFEAIQPTRMI